MMGLLREMDRWFFECLEEDLERVMVLVLEVNWKLGRDFYGIRWGELWIYKGIMLSWSIWGTDSHFYYRIPVSVRR
jgi:hypothetical protein